MTLPKIIRVLLVDDHLLFHDAVMTALSGADDIALVGRSTDGAEALDLCERLKPDLILMDVLMPKMSGIEVARRIYETDPDVKILALSSFQEYEIIREMLENGAVGYVLKGSLADDLVATIRAAYTGKRVFSDEIVQTLLEPFGAEAVDFGLTRRELEVLRLLSAGLSNGQIAVRLVISASTVKFHLVNIIAKMHVRTRSEAIVLAAKHHLL
jgi:NarL family two-component system response regulator LiaR